jgi:hypothetical protein
MWSCLSKAAPTWAQTDDPFSIRVESNLVVVQVSVYDKGRMHQETSALRQCWAANDLTFNRVRPSEPYLPKACYEFGIKGLGIGDFHVFEDGIERKIESASFVPWPIAGARDDLGFHNEWSYTPRGKWSSADLKSLRDSTMRLDFYQISYIPLKPEEGKCHKIQVTVDRPNAVVFARDQYCYTEHPVTDPLNGTGFGKQLETDLDSDERAKIALALQATFFYTASQVARVDIVLEFPWDHLEHEWFGLDLHANVGVLGEVYDRHGSLVTRVSDFACCMPGSPWSFLLFDSVLDPGPYLAADLDPWLPIFLPSRYETQIDLPSGEYDLKVILGDGKKFGRALTRLKIDPYDGKQLAISSIVLSNRFRDAHAAMVEAEAVNLAPRYVPLVSQGVQFTPVADTRFQRKDHIRIYFEVYEPMLASDPKTTVQARIRIVDIKTGEIKANFDPIDAAPYRRPGSTVFAVAGDFPIAELRKGDYRVEVQASDSAGRSTVWRSASFTIE